MKQAFGFWNWSYLPAMLEINKGFDTICHQNVSNTIRWGRWSACWPNMDWK